jgi:hypothetical protein
VNNANKASNRQEMLQKIHLSRDRVDKKVRAELWYRCCQYKNRRF